MTLSIWYPADRPFALFLGFITGLMRYFLRFGLVALGLCFFLSCNRGGRQEAVQADSLANVSVHGDSAITGVTASQPALVSTFFSDTIPCQGCPGTIAVISLETDSTCIWTEQRLEKGSVPLLQYGRVERTDSLLALFLPGNKVLRFRVSEAGMRMVDEKGMTPAPPGDYTLEPNPAGFIDFTQPFMVDGKYFFQPEGANFTPAGQATIYPVNPGKGSFDAEKIYLGRSRKDTGDLCLRAIVRIMKARDLAGMEVTMAYIDKVVGRGGNCE